MKSGLKFKTVVAGRRIKLKQGMYSHTFMTTQRFDTLKG